MRMDELKALRLRRTQLRAELARINALLEVEVGEDVPDSTPCEEEFHAPEPMPRPKPIGDDWATARKNFYRDAENDFRNSGPNGNYE